MGFDLLRFCKIIPLNQLCPCAHLHQLLLRQINQLSGWRLESLIKLVSTLASFAFRLLFSFHCRVTKVNNCFLKFFFSFLCRAAKRFIGMSIMLKIWEWRNYTVGSIFRSNVESHPNKTAFMLEENNVINKITFQEVMWVLMKVFLLMQNSFA